MKRKKKMTWVKRFMWFKLAFGLSLAFVFFAMLVWSAVSAPTTETGICGMVKYGILFMISLVVAAAGTCGGCLG